MAHPPTPSRFTRTVRRRWWIGPIIVVVVAGAVALKLLTAPLQVSASVSEGDREVARTSGTRRPPGPPPAEGRAAAGSPARPPGGRLPPADGRSPHHPAPRRRSPGADSDHLELRRHAALRAGDPGPQPQPLDLGPGELG